MTQREVQRRRAGRGLVSVVTLLLLLATGGCTFSDVPVVVAGYDTNGTLVVGATDCSVGSSDPDAIRVTHTREGQSSDLLWWIEDDPLGRDAGVPMGPSSPVLPPDPGNMDEVTLLAVGDPDPPGWSIQQSLTGSVPEGGMLEVQVTPDSSGRSEITVDLPAGRSSDRYSARVGDERFVDVDGAEMVAAIEETCDEATAFDGGLFFAVLGGTGLGLLVVGGFVGILLTRQYKRAGTAARERRAGAN